MDRGGVCTGRIDGLETMDVIGVMGQMDGTGPWFSLRGKSNRESSVFRFAGSITGRVFPSL